MTSPFLPNFRPASLFVILIMVLQLSACGSEDLLSAISPEIGSGTNTVTSGTTIISGVSKGSIVEDVDPDGDNLLEVGGKLEIIDSDSADNGFIAKTVNGDYGNLKIDTSGNWNYAADNSQPVIQNLEGNDTLTDNLVISSVDGTTLTVEITIIGVIDSVDNTNTAAVISGTDIGNVTEDIDPDNDSLLETSGKLNITDSDTGEDAFIATTFNGKYGNLTIDAVGNWSYAAGNNQPAIQNLATGANLVDSLVISSLDGTTHSITITISGADETNSPAVISGTDSGSVTEDVDPDNDNLLETSGKLNITDSDSGEAAFVAVTISGSYGSLTINAAGSWNYAANNTQNAIQNLNTGNTLFDSLIISSIDGTTRAIVITIVGSNEVTATSNIDLSWAAPAEREDNTPISLSEIAGYKVYYGPQQGQYPNSVNVNDSSAAGYTFQNFSSGTYYFVVTTIDTEGRESSYSTEIIFTI